MKKSNITATIIGLLGPIIVFAADPGTVAHNAADNVHIRNLAASCAACHGANGNSVNSSQVDKVAALAGVNPADFKSKMLAYKSGARAATVMHHHAKGLTVEEIAGLAEYFAAQSVLSPASLPSQKLLTDHEN